jgi:hypothetical protein
MWKIRKLDEQLFQGAAAKIHAFLDIEPLMPPGRLRMSKLFGRPVMDELKCNCTAAAHMEEIRDMDCRVHGRQTTPFFFTSTNSYFMPWRGPARDAPDLAGIRIISAEDKAWGQAWYEKEGCHWPCILDNKDPIPHPALDDLVASHEDFYDDWEADMSDCEEVHTSVEFAKCPVCTETYIDDVEA